MKSWIFIYSVFAFVHIQCGQADSKRKITAYQNSVIYCEKNLPFHYAALADTSNIVKGENSIEGMVWIAGGEFMMGATDNEGRDDEYPQHKVLISGFWMDATEVTNAKFKKFVEETGYITTAEKAPDWEECSYRK